MAQVKSAQEKLADDLYEMTKPLARSRDDEDLERLLKEREREGDPMLAFITKKKTRQTELSGKKGKLLVSECSRPGLPFMYFYSFFFALFFIQSDPHIGGNFLRTDLEFGPDIGGTESTGQTGLRKQYMQDEQKNSRSRTLLINGVLKTCN